METDAGSGGLVVLLVYGIILVLMIAAIWKVFTKAGQPGWAALIPIYNTYVLLQIAGKPWWWLLLMLVPVANLIVSIMATVALAQAFGKGAGFAVGLILLPFVFFPILAFGDAEYAGVPA